MTTPGYGVQNPSGQGHALGGQEHANFSYAGAAGGLLVLIGSFLAWVKAEAGGESETVKGMDGDGVFTLIAGIAAIALFLAGVFMQKAIVSAIGAAPGVIALIFAVLNFADTERLVKAKLEDDGASSSQAEKFASQLDISASFGLYIVLIGALVATVAGVLVFLKARR
ncbi:Trp biosynthesis-associated membrane protein [Yinghuangia sp. ASG 101]|uniref:Trp biosynthesis-associated membrane protein n=1 Tax=Yinghuangia sp. ASG 101 TaxID=2896848 RepID=UPI001E5478C3|nr:Trp biosynthesis-associated membrane protein [Yinghuangia sp. ASG 101]UGQ14439.1 Trp biosynthesis-associated membrane protein [Yinghuangia sp. ASG 101]